LLTMRKQKPFSADEPKPMQWLYEQWHAFADWAAGQPVYVQLPIGIAILVVAYLLFLVVISRLFRLPPRPGRDTQAGRDDQLPAGDRAATRRLA